MAKEINKGGDIGPSENVSPAPGNGTFREMTIAQKLNRANELLKQYEGTDKYDAFKKRVDAMKHKYGAIARVVPDAKWNYDEASQAVQKGLPDLRPNIQVAGSGVTPNYDSAITQNQNFLNWASGRGWASRFVGNFGGQNKRIAASADTSRNNITYLQGMKSALGYALANPERATALGTLVTPRQTLSTGFPTKFVWNENLGQYNLVPNHIKVKPREPVQEVQQNAKGGQARKALRADAKGGDGGQPEDIPPESGGASVSSPAGGGPRIVINPTTFHNKKDALCVAFNEGFRLWMEATGFEPRSEPTEAQRKFFSDTAYADDELQLRRTILARIATFDTSVKDPTDGQLAETAEFLGAILESDWCKNEWERDSVSRLAQAAQAAVGTEPVEPRGEPLEAREAEPLQARAAMGGGETDDKRQQEAPAQESEDLNGDGTVIDHQADVEAQQETESQDERNEIDAEYEKLKQSGALDNNASFDNSGQSTDQKQAQEPAAQEAGKDTAQPASADPVQPGAANPAKQLAKGSIQADIVSPDSPGSLSYKGPRRGGIEDDIVSKDSPGSLSYKGTRKGGIENDIVSPDSPGSLSYKGRKKGSTGRPRIIGAPVVQGYIQDDEWPDDERPGM